MCFINLIYCYCFVLIDDELNPLALLLQPTYDLSTVILFECVWVYACVYICTRPSRHINNKARWMVKNKVHLFLKKATKTIINVFQAILIYTEKGNWFLDHQKM